MRWLYDDRVTKGTMCRVASLIFINLFSTVSHLSIITFFLMDFPKKKKGVP